MRNPFTFHLSPLTSRPGFTLIEVLMAMLILVLFPVGALITTLQLEKNARLQSEEMAAAAFCEDVYNRCLREENFAGTDGKWKSLSTKTVDSITLWQATSGAASGIYLPAVRLKDGTFYTPLMRDINTFRTPQVRIVKQGTSDDDHDVRVSLRWGPKSESYRYYHY